MKVPEHKKRAHVVQQQNTELNRINKAYAALKGNVNHMIYDLKTQQMQELVLMKTMKIYLKKNRSNFVKIPSILTSF